MHKWITQAFLKVELLCSKSCVGRSKPCFITYQATIGGLSTKLTLHWPTQDVDSKCPWTNSILNLKILWDMWVSLSYYFKSKCILDWCVVSQGHKNKHHKYTLSKEIGQRLWLILTTPYSVSNTIVEKNHPSSYEINNHALPTIRSKANEVRVLVWLLWTIAR